ncbi:MAG: sigma-70 family RNA polymerase sigma factor [Parcubacteria group bacterium]
MDAAKERSVLEACQRGDTEMFGELYDVYIEKIYSFIYYRTSHRETAEDLTSATFMKALEHIGQFRSGSFSSWLYRIARNTVTDYYRTSKNVSSLDDALEVMAGRSGAEDSERKLIIEQVKQYLQTLKQEHQDVVLMRIWDDLPYKHIAEITGKSEANCKMIVSRSLSTIRKQFAIAAALILIGLLFFHLI